jgi:hypothetical protein
MLTEQLLMGSGEWGLIPVRAVALAVDLEFMPNVLAYLEKTAAVTDKYANLANPHTTLKKK